MPWRLKGRRFKRSRRTDESGPWLFYKQCLRGTTRTDRFSKRYHLHIAQCIRPQIMPAASMRRLDVMMMGKEWPPTTITR
ncbi:hypothetical protein CENSYa_0806 [Cenarchaeum symbiosum A]|uniref:Uncharacterized protein n=1 Tax=Cenarchaeum symbiosum (strain A) TaxID=414004 RepID=A0RVS2_CENSY|nr:hypothetical protein CENSYa_0806 [Cenarchaeum symbiosum A]